MTEKERIKKDNLFNIHSPRRYTLAFITQGGHISGKVMKGIKFRLPNIIEELKLKIKENNNIGEVIKIGSVIFVVYRKHYNSRVSLEQFENILSEVSEELNKYKLKTTNEDLPQFRELIEKHLPNIEYRYSSEWS